MGTKNKRWSADTLYERISRSNILIEKYASDITERFTASDIEDFRNNVARYKSFSENRTASMSEKKSATSRKRNLNERMYTKICAIHDIVRRSSANDEIRNTYGTGANFSRKYSLVIMNAHAICSAFEKYPDWSMAHQILAQDVNELESMLTQMNEVEYTKNKINLSRQEETILKYNVHKELEDKIIQLSFAGELRFSKDLPKLAMLFKKLRKYSKHSNTALDTNTDLPPQDDQP